MLACPGSDHGVDEARVGGLTGLGHHSVVQAGPQPLLIHAGHTVGGGFKTLNVPALIIYVHNIGASSLQPCPALIDCVFFLI